MNQNHPNADGWMILALDPQFIRDTEDLACGEDYCLVCSRATDHWGEHTDSQLLAWVNRYDLRLV